MSEFLSKVVYLTPNQYNSLLLGQTIGGQTFDPSALYITNTPGDADDAATVNGHTVETDVPPNAHFDADTWRPIGNGANDAAAGNHGHGNITNAGLLGNANRLVWTDVDKKIYAGYHYTSSTKVAINSSDEPTENFYVSGTIQFNLGTSNTSTNYRKFTIQGADNNKMSIAPTGLQVYNSNNTATTLYFQAYGGNMIFGSSSYATATRDMYGQFDFKSAQGFTYSGIGSGTDNASRPIWFSYAGINGRPVIDNDFKYNPSTNTITIGTATLSATTYTGTAANVTGTIAIDHGGTGQTTASEAWVALGGGDSGKHADSYFVKTITSTDNAIVRFDGTSGQIQDSGITIDDNNRITANASGQSISNIKIFSGNSGAGGDYVGWIKFAEINLNNSNNFGSCLFDIFISRSYNTPSPETYSIRLSVAWSTYNIVQLGGRASGQIITSFRVVKDNTNHKAYFEYYVPETATSNNTTYIRIISYLSRDVNMISSIQTEADSDFSSIGTLTLSSNGLVGDITGNASSATSATTAESLTNKTLTTTSINNTSGSYTFSIAATTGLTQITTASTDYVGLQIGDSKDKWQLTATGNHLYFRQNDSGGTNTSWENWVKILDTSTTAAGANNNATLDWNTSYTIAKIDNTNIQFTTMAMPVTSIEGHTGAVSISDLGLSNALHFIGITSTTLTDGSTTSTLTPKVASPSSLSKTTGFIDGDVVMDGDQLREYVWSGNAWRLLGITTSTAYSQTATGNSWITSITQGTDGKITATTGTLDTTGTWEGNAGTATKWASAQKVYVTLGTASTTTTIQGGSTSAQTIGVNGTLGISNGGTGNTTFTQDCIITYTSNSKLESRGLKVTGATSADIIITPYATNKNLTINANGTGKLTVSSNYGSLILQGGAANTTTYSVLTLGNSTAKASANQSEGKITLYSASTAAHIIDGASTATDYTHTFPNKTGYIVIGSTDDIGSDTGPVYLSDGELIECASVAQTADFTLTGVSGAGSATIGSDTTISSNTEVIQISIDYTTASYLNSPISWTITNNRIVLSASVTTGESVTGKIYFIKNSA